MKPTNVTQKFNKLCKVSDNFHQIQYFRRFHMRKISSAGKTWLI